MRLQVFPPCMTQANVGELEAGNPFPPLNLKFYSRNQKSESLIIQSTKDDGTVLDTMVIVVAPKTGKLTASRRSQPIELDIDKE